MNSTELYANVNNALETIRPFLMADGGDIELVEITSENVAKVKLLGACGSCSMSTMTMKAGVEEAIKKAAPQIKSVEAVAYSLELK